VAVLVGASGSGKTTLLRLLAGLELPDAGRIYLDGRLASEPGWALAPHRRGIGFAFQRSALWPHMTVAQNIAFGLGDAPRDRVRVSVWRLLAEMQLDGLADRYPDQLSGGQSRRVALARALAPEPRFLLLDEPLTNIEPELKKRLLTVVRGHAERTGACVVYVTHDADEAAATGGRTSILRDGRLSNRERD
jgi:iron(III) transport system ATP-binding protein